MGVPPCVLHVYVLTCHHLPIALAPYQSVIYRQENLVTPSMALSAAPPPLPSDHLWLLEIVVQTGIHGCLIYY